jgi:putative flavoprotein involved in K+ transport
MPQIDHELDAVVVGAGWAGLSASSALKAAGFRHVVFERHRTCETWRTQRWMSFRMNTPNVQTVMPGDTYRGDDPEGFMTCRDFVDMVAGYAERRGLPVETGTPVKAVRPFGTKGFEVVTSQGITRAKSVVIASGNLNVPKRPALATALPPTIQQIDGSDYREAGQLKPGAVLVIGCGNSGGQIAEDLVRSGRTVYLATGHNGRVPRRYRGRDISLWLRETGRYDLPKSSETGRPLLGATHTISLQSLSARGVIMLGRFAGMKSSTEMAFADDLRENARFGDRVSADIKRDIDAFIERKGLSVVAASVDEAEAILPRFPQPPILELDLRSRGITTVVWCIGFTGDFNWVEVPGALDGRGLPAQRGCLSVPGIYFIGLDTPEALKAGTILVAAEESGRIVDHMVRHGANR